VNIDVLSTAEDDLTDGFFFYEAQEEGLGGYFLQSLYAEIESLNKYAGIHPVLIAGCTECSQSAFPSRFITVSTGTVRAFMLSSIAAAAPHGFESAFDRFLQLPCNDLCYVTRNDPLRRT
jgi:hypothetical protein